MRYGKLLSACLLFTIFFCLTHCGKKVDLESQIHEGELLVNSSDCKTCHHTANKLIGPSYMDVAKKYPFTEKNVKMLAQRIIKGGSGVWGEIPMNAHPDLPVEDAEKMVWYILSLDDEREK